MLDSEKLRLHSTNGSRSYRSFPLLPVASDLSKPWEEQSLPDQVLESRRLQGNHKKPKEAKERRERKRKSLRSRKMTMNSIHLRMTMKKMPPLLLKLSRRRQLMPRRRQSSQRPLPSPLSSGKSSRGDQKLTSMTLARRSLTKSKWMASRGKQNSRRSLSLSECSRSWSELQLKMRRSQPTKCKKWSKPLKTSFNLSTSSHSTSSEWADLS